MIDMNNSSLTEVIRDYFDCALAEYSEAREALDADELASDLKRKGCCTNPYFAYEKALICPINKRREAQCACVHCESYGFCEVLRKEGYI